MNLIFERCEVELVWLKGGAIFCYFLLLSAIFCYFLLFWGSGFFIFFGRGLGLC